MRLLMLGGTRFLGRATAAHAVAAGHEVTCAARGLSGPVAGGAELVRVDRSVPDGLAPLAGPEDPSDRFTYWPVRLARPDRPVLAPSEPAEPVQWIDVRDLAAWLVSAAERGLTGTLDAAGAAVSRAEFLAGIAAGVGADPE